jgi:hypothetical protein
MDFPNIIKIIDNCLDEDTNNQLIKLAKFQELLETKKQDNISFHSKFGLLENENIHFQKLRRLFKSNLNKHIQSLNSIEQDLISDNCKDPVINKTTLSEIKSWCLIQRQNAYCSPHTHFFIQWSCIYYCTDNEIPSPEGLLEIIDPKILGSLSNFRTESIFIKPKKYRMVLLPAFLIHWTHPILHNIERISYVCDFNVQEYY